MSTKDTGGPAFPEVRIRSGDNYTPPTKLYYGGMTLRDYFAGEAMPIAVQRLKHNYDKEIGGGKWAWDDGDWESIAMHAWDLADAMLKARPK